MPKKKNETADDILDRIKEDLEKLQGKIWEMEADDQVEDEDFDDDADIDEDENE